MPQYVISNQRMGTTGRCVVNLSWSSPTNIATSDITHYMVHINGTNIANETQNVHEPLTLATYPLCDCGSHSVSISAVDHCGRMGQSTPNLYVTVDPEPFELPELLCEDGFVTEIKPADDTYTDVATTTATNGRDKGK